jgi:hypothetical protein
MSCDENLSAGRTELFCMRLSALSMRFHVERDQGFSNLLALSEGRGPVAVVAVTVEAQTLAGEQAVGDHSDGHFGDRLECAVGASHGKFESRF